MITVTIDFVLWALINIALLLSLAINGLIGFMALAKKHPTWFYEEETYYEEVEG